MEVFEEASRNSEDLGMSDADILTALGRGRDDLDPFGIICRVLGTIMRLIGPLLTAIILGISLVLFVRMVANQIARLGSWLKSVASNIPFLGSFFSVASAIMKDEQRMYDDNAENLAGAALGAMIETAIPMPVWRGLNLVVDQLGSAGSSQPVSAPQAPPSGSTSLIPRAMQVAAIASPPVGVATLVASGIDKILNMFKTSGKADGENLTAAELAALCNAAGRDPREFTD